MLPPPNPPPTCDVCKEEVLDGVCICNAPTPKIIEASDAFQSREQQMARPALPEMTKQELIDIGITLVESDRTRALTIPFKSQKRMLESVKGFGFGAPKAVEALLQRTLQIFGFKGEVAFHTPEGTFDLVASQDLVPKDAAGATPPPAPEKDKPEPPIPKEASLGETEAIIAERGKIYGDPELSHTNIGYAWTGLIQQHYQTVFPYPFPAWLVELMMGQFKINRAARVFHDDNYIDLDAYVMKFAREHQRAAFAEKKL